MVTPNSSRGVAQAVFWYKIKQKIPFLSQEMKIKQKNKYKITNKKNTSSILEDVQSSTTWKQNNVF